MTFTPLTDRRSVTPRAPVPRRALPDAVVIALIGFALSVAFSWVPSVWYDESATIVAATRSWADLGRMLGTVDAVHGLYYALMHVWFDLVGYTPFTLRLPSAVATGLAAGLIVTLVRSLASRRTAVYAGLLFCLLPRVTWMGEEGRSFALTTACAIVLTLVFLAAWRRSAAQPGSGWWARCRWWWLYSALAVLFTGLFLYVALLVVAHGVTAVWTTVRARRQEPGAPRGWAPLRGWLIASIGAGLAVLPFAVTVVGQSGQVSWIDPISLRTVTDVFVVQWFMSNAPFAVIGWALIVLGITVLLSRARSTPAPGVTNTLAPTTSPALLELSLPWLTVPTLGLVAASLVMTPVFSPRYLVFAAPAAAILMAVTVSALPGRWMRLSSIALCVALLVPSYVAQRLPEAKQNSSWSEVSSLLERERAIADNGGAADGVIYGPVRQHASATTRVIAYSYPAGFEGTVDLNIQTPAAQTDGLWETTYPLAEVQDRFENLDTVWLVTSDRQDWRPSIRSKLGALGFSFTAEWNLTGVNVLRFTR
ncbi:MAG: hypothetical protein R6W83_10370 [Cryobacterium sp.]